MSEWVKKLGFTCCLRQLGCHNKDHRPGGLNNNNLFLHLPVAPPESQLPGLQVAVFILCPHNKGRVMGRANSLVSSYKGTYPFLMISSEPNHLPKALYPNTIPLGGRASTYEFWEGTIQSIAMHCLIWPLITPWHRFQFRPKKRKFRKLNLPKGAQLGHDRTWKFSNLRIFVLKTTEDFCCLMRLLRHYPFWFEAIWSEGKCESVWSRNVKANSNAEESIQQRAGEHLNTEGKEYCECLQPRKETGGRSVTGNWSPEDWGWSLEFWCQHVSSPTGPCSRVPHPSAGSDRLFLEQKKRSK